IPDLLEVIKRNVFSIIKRLPIIRTIVAKEIEKAVLQIRNNTKKMMSNPDYHLQLPKEGWSKEIILEEIDKYQNSRKINWKNGRVSGTVYGNNDLEVKDLMTCVFNKTAWTNPLHPDVFPDVIKMETEIVKMVCHLFGGRNEECGMVTSGGTESIILACKTYREYAKYEKGIKCPEIIVPVTAHAAFEKAAHYLKIRIKKIPMNLETMQVDTKAMKKAITKNTCLLVGSSPPFPHGILDPIEEIAKLGMKYNIPVHVDACLGGFLLPFMKKAGFDIPICDFRLSGVTSISADMHKYGFTPKGSSVILYRNPTYLRYQYTVQTDWPGGVYITPNIGGSRAGSNIATCWATMMYYGEDGYIETTRRIVKTTRYIENGLRSIPGIFIFGKPQMSVIALGSKEFDIFCLISLLNERGWNLNNLQYPSGFHICVTLQHTEEGIADSFLHDIRECTALIMKDPKSPAKGMAAMYGVAQSIPDRSIVAELATAFLNCCYDVDQKKAE
ncbi:sphingosine-1-phosphate lyase-like, partial [Centruroides sculpturatus]|uniref:sphingosine-1-phosphate lyase-like n=1 Tax=Centruroides sculpturatus TaxID=218467 RepID=UPI000C6ED0E6